MKYYILYLLMLISFNIFSQIDTTLVDTIQLSEINFNIDTLITDTLPIDTIIPIDTNNTKRNASNGFFIYEVIDTMYVNEPKVINFSLAKDLIIENVVRDLGITNYDLKYLRIDRKMQITIENMDNPILMIKPNPPIKKQTMSDGRQTPWFWTLKTLKTGTVCFTVNISYILRDKITNEETPQNITHVEYKIVSISNATLLEKLEIFFNKYWQWIFGTFVSSIVLPLSFFIYNNKKKK